MNTRNKKITILGVGNVGASIAYSLVIDGMCSEIVLVDINKDKARGEVIELRQSAVFCPSVKISYGDYADAVDSDIVVVTLGMARKPGQTRLDLAQTNTNIMKQIMPEVAKYAPNAIYVIVSNPVDIMTYAALKSTNLSPSQVIGTGTLLDTIRLQEGLSEYLDISTSNVQAYVLGEHGDSSMVPWSFASVAGMPLIEYCKLMTKKDESVIREELNVVYKDMQTSGSNIIKLKGATYYGVALCVRHLCDALFRHGDIILPVSVLMQGQYGMEDVCLSLPTVINSNGVKQIIEYPFNDEEKEKLLFSYNALKSTLSKIQN